MAPETPDDLVFRTVKGTPLNDKNLYNRELAPACDRIGQPRVSWHSFRHTHATLLHANGETLKTAQALLGHSDLETTLNVYIHTVSDSQKERCRASGENPVERGFGLSWTQLCCGGNAGRTAKLMRNRMLRRKEVVNRGRLEPPTR